MEQFWSYNNPANPSDPEASPLLNKNFTGLARAYVQIAGMDPLRDEGIAYVEKLRQAGYVQVHNSSQPLSRSSFLNSTCSICCLTIFLEC